jgi:pimeloyl-ACP methyl ester carboxylesterase
MHSVLYLPGLGRSQWLYSIPAYLWRRHGLDARVYPWDWYDLETFECKLKRLIRNVDQLRKKYTAVSLVGSSAGGSVALNMLLMHPRLVHRVINIGGRLRPGIEHGIQGYTRRTASSAAFGESVLYFSSHEHRLSQDQRKRIMTIRPRFGDELVPADTVGVWGAKNITIPTIEHVISNALAFTLFSRLLQDFIRED